MKYSLHLLFRRAESPETLYQSGRGRLISLLVTNNIAKYILVIRTCLYNHSRGPQRCVTPFILQRELAVTDPLRNIGKSFETSKPIYRASRHSWRITISTVSYKRDCDHFVAWAGSGIWSHDLRRESDPRPFFSAKLPEDSDSAISSFRPLVRVPVNAILSSSQRTCP